MLITLPRFYPIYLTYRYKINQFNIYWIKQQIYNFEQTTNKTDKNMRLSEQVQNHEAGHFSLAQHFQSVLFGFYFIWRKRGQEYQLFDAVNFCNKMTGWQKQCQRSGNGHIERGADAETQKLILVQICIGIGLGYTIVQMKNSVILYNPNLKADKASYIQEVMEGLSKAQKELPFKFVYDDEGSRLITSINSTPIYYIWKCEKDIFKLHGEKMLEMMGPSKFNLIDLGAGDASKTRILLEKALSKKIDLEYIPMDISHDSNEWLKNKLIEEMPGLKMTTLTSQFEEGIKWVQANKAEKNVYLFVGATIGNATKQENERFVKYLGSEMKKGDQIFVGFDKMKKAEVITRAYLDNGYEERFIINNLKRLNKELGSNFDLEKFDAFPYFDPHSRCMEFVVISKEDQEVEIEGQVVSIKEAEVIKMGKSRKWLTREAVELFQLGGMEKVAMFEDEKEYYSYIVFQKV